METDAPPAAAAPVAPPAAAEYSAALGRSGFGWRLTREEYGLGGADAWRVVLSYRRPRARAASAAAMPVLDITPRRPLLTLSAGGESFPLLVTECQAPARGGALTLGGSRKLMLRQTHLLRWSLRVTPRALPGGRVDLRAEYKLTCVPPLPARDAAELLVAVASPLHDAALWQFPHRPRAHDGASLLWSARAAMAVSLVVPDAQAQTPAPHAAPLAGEASLRCAVPAVLRRGRGAGVFWLRCAAGPSQAEASAAHLAHVAQQLPAALPLPREQRPGCARPLLSYAEEAAAALLAPERWARVGMERVYQRARPTCAASGSDPGEWYSAGFPAYPVESSGALLDWLRWRGGSEGGVGDGGYHAQLVARAVATDFAVHSGASKGALWERRTPGRCPDTPPLFSGARGDAMFSITATARVAGALLRVGEQTGDAACAHAGIAAAQWLILKQNSAGGYDGDAVRADTGALLPCSQADGLAEIDALVPLVLAYRATRREVYAQNAMRMLGRLSAERLPRLVAAPLAVGACAGDGTGAGSPLTVAALVQALAAVQAVTGAECVAPLLHRAGDWLRAWDLAGHAAREPGSGVALARAALTLFRLDGRVDWLQTGLALLTADPAALAGAPEHDAILGVLELLFSLLVLVRPGELSRERWRAEVCWTRFEPEPATARYFSATTTDGRRADALPLVSRAGALLAVVLAPADACGVALANNGRQPLLKDHLTGETVAQPAPLHDLPFASAYKWGCYELAP